MIGSLYNLLRRWLWLLVLTTLIAGGISYLGGKSQPTEYSAKTQLLVGPATSSLNPQVNDLRAAAQLLEVYAVLPTMRPFQESVIDKLGLPYGPSRLQKSITITTDSIAQILTIRVNNSDPDQAQLIANTVAELLVTQSPYGTDQDAKSQLQDQISRVEGAVAKSEERLRELEANLQTANSDQERAQIDTQISQERVYQSEAERLLVSLYSAQQSTPNNQISVIEPAIRGKPVDPQIRLRTMLGVLGGLLLGVIIMFAVEYFNNTLTNVSDLERVTDVPVLSALRTHRFGGRARLITFSHSGGTAAEHYRRLAIDLRVSVEKQALRNIVIGDIQGDAAAGEIAANLAVVLAQLGNNVVLIDADPRESTVTRLFGLTGTHGLSDLVQGGTDVADLVVEIPDIPGLAVLPYGISSGDFLELSASPRFEDALSRFQEVADLTIVAVPPFQIEAGGLMLASRVDGTLLVATSGRTRQPQLLDVIRSLQKLDAPIWGVLLAVPSQKLGISLPFRKPKPISIAAHSKSDTAQVHSRVVRRSART